MAGKYAKRIRQLRLYKRLEQSWKEDSGFAEEDIKDLTALIGNVADEVGPLLQRIPDTFQQYTEHGIEHSCNVINLMEKFIPKKTFGKLNPLELSLLMLSALLHDMGMVVEDQEKEEALSSDEFRAFLMRHQEHQEAIEDAERQGQVQRSRAISDALLAEYFRRIHSERVRDRLKTDKLKSLLIVDGYDISSVLGNICESHSWPVSASGDPSNTNKCVARLECEEMVGNISVNEQFIACCLRLGDILDFDRSRTPLSVFNHIDFTEDKSWEEWNKHLSISGWKINKSNVSFSAKCTHTTFFVAVNDFIDDIDNELMEIHYVLSEAPRPVSEFYTLNLPRLADRRRIRMKDPKCVAGAFRFNLDYEGIMRLLMDKSLYPDPSLFLRELLQNSLDACRRKEALAHEAGRIDAYAPRICVWDHSKDTENPRIVFQDNGIGMSQHILENYFMRVGRSYYRSSEFNAERARLAERDIELDACSSFGIGILSCFLVADRFEVETYQHDHDPLHVEIEGANKYFIITRLDKPESQMFEPKPESDSEDGPPKRTGTRVTVHLRPNVEIKVNDVIESFAVNTDYDIAIYQPESEQPKMIESRRWEKTKVEFCMPFVNFEYGTRAEDIANNFQGVVEASVIPFESWDFSKHLHGPAWFWLLVDTDGKLCPQVGYLEISGNNIELTGLPGLLRQLQKRVPFPSNKENRALISSSLHQLTSEEDPKILLSEKYDSFRDRLIHTRTFSARQLDGRTVTKAISDVLKRTVDSINPIWPDMDSEERAFAAKYIESNSNLQSGKIWYRKPELPGQLLRKENIWMNESMRFYITKDRGVLADDPTVQEVALRSVKIPAGIIDWDPVKMTTDESPAVPMPGGMFIDARGIDAPTPSVNRMFIPHSQSKKGLLIPYWRAAIKHAVELMEDHDEPPRWAKWFHLLCQKTLHYGGKEAVKAERKIITPHLAFQVRLNGREIFLSKEEVLKRFGSSVSHTSGNADGIVKAYRDDITGYRTDVKLSSGRVKIIGD